MGWKRNGAGLMLALLCVGAPVQAQSLDTVGVRAAGMAGAFVAVASDSSAVWWNPGALPAGALADASFSWVSADQPGRSGPARSTALAVGVPVAGFHFSRSERGDRGGGRSLTVTQAGMTLVQTLVSGVHLGGTVKYLRGAGVGRWDADLGLVAVHRQWRVGLLARQLGAPDFRVGPGTVTLPRHVRAGLAFDAAAADGPPVILSADVDLTTSGGADGTRRDVAVGVERWVRPARLAVRGGVRASTSGPARTVLTAGVSLALRPALLLEVSGGAGTSAGQGSWGGALRASF